MIYPEGIVIGLNVIHAYGWITQTSRTFDLVIESNSRSVTQINEIELRKRDKAWFQSQQENKNILRQGKDSSFTLDSLTPQAELDDIRKMKDMWVPYLEDLYLPDDFDHPRPTQRERFK